MTPLKQQLKAVGQNKCYAAAILPALALFISLGTIGCGVSTPHSSSASAQSSHASTTSSSNTEANSPAVPNNTNASTAASATSSASPALANLLASSSSNLSFGNVQVGQSTSQLITLTNAGNASIEISGITASGSGFSTAGAEITLTAKQSVNIYVNFAPAVAGSANGTVSIISNATDSLLSISLTGTGAASQQQAHSVELAWTPSSSNVIGYFVERSTTTGGPYTKVNSNPNANPTYTDSSVSTGTYFYVVTAVDSNNVESAPSNEVQTIVP